MLKMQKLTRSICFRRKPGTMKAFSEYKRDQSLPITLLEQKQLSKLNTLLNHAYANVPYYRDLFDNLNMAENGRVALSSFEELKTIPFLTRETVRKEKERLFSRDHKSRKSFVNSSGGSTGEPVELLQDEDYLVANTASMLLVNLWRGVGPYDSEVFIWGAERDTFEGKKPLTGYIGDFLRNRITLNCFKMTQYDMKQYIRILNKHRPGMIRAYADAIYEIARYAKLNNIEVVPQDVIHTGAGNLYDFMRTEIEEVFRCRVFDHYGCREVGSIASECTDHNGMHIMMEHNVVEIVDREGRTCPPGKEGEIAVTNLNNYSMPIIRYKIGDLGIFKEYTKCSCGCTYLKLAAVTGRVCDVFRTDNGAVVSPAYLIHLIGVVCKGARIKKFQAIQKDYRHILIRIEKSDEMNEDRLGDIEDKVKLVMGKSCSVEFEFVDRIEKTPTGKYRYTISEVGESV